MAIGAVIFKKYGWCLGFLNVFYGFLGGGIFRFFWDFVWEFNFFFFWKFGKTHKSEVNESSNTVRGAVISTAGVGNF